MTQQRKMNKKRHKKKLGRIFVRAVMITFITLGIVIGGFAFVYHNFLYDKQDVPFFEPKKNDPINKTLAVFGVDEDGVRTDVIFVVNYNSETGKMRVISVPRDTKVEWTSDEQSIVEMKKGYTITTSKINEMTSYGGMENIRALTINQIENMLDIQIDNYVIITLDAFRKIVDAIGGVEVDVPNINGSGFHYDDNYQNLHIHLEPGRQLLDGSAAEGLVRFRKGYAEGDVGRIKTQQLFLEAFAKKVTSPSIITKVPGIMNAVLETVSTDVKLSEVAGYFPYLKSMNADDLTFNIVPGEGKYMDGKSYYIVDEEAIPGFMEDVFSDKEEVDPIETATIDKTVSIQILNSTGTSGLASREKERLEEEGYSVEEIGNYTLDTLLKSIIYVRNEELGTQFLKYYPQATIKMDENIAYDICIVLGRETEETN